MHTKGKRGARPRQRPPETPGVIWISASGEFLAAQVDHDDWLRLRHLNFQTAAKGYARARVPGAGRDYLHRLVLHLAPDERWPDGSRKVIDHLNRDKLDCRKINMRICTQKENCANRGGIYEKSAA